MSMPMGPESSSAPREPTRELLLAQALDACIEAERRARGSAAEIIARQPAWARDELRRLVDLAGSLDSAAAKTVISEDFRVAARERLMQRIAGRPGVASDSGAGAWLAPVPSTNGHVYRIVRRPARWMWRGVGGGLLAAALVAAATLSASASSLPGDPLYGLKQAQEEIGVRLASDDEARALALLHQADARLDETTRLLREGRTAESAAVAQRYDEVVERATTTYVVAIDDSSRDDDASTRMDSKLSQQQEQLQALLQTAPEPARADLREALVATERGRALVADPRPVDRVLGRGAPPRPAAAVALPTMAVEDEPTPVPTATPLPPTPVPVVVAEAPTPTAVVAEAREPERHEDESAEDRSSDGRSAEGRSVVTTQPASNRGPSRGGPPSAPARVQPAPGRDQEGDQRGGGGGDERGDGPGADEVLPAVPVIAENAPARGDGSAQVDGRRAAPTNDGDNGDERAGNQPAQVAETRGPSASGDGGQRSGDDQQQNDSRGRSGGGEPQVGTGGRSGDQQQTDKGGRSGDDTPQPAVARQGQSQGQAPQADVQSADNRGGGRSGDDNPSPAPRATTPPPPAPAVNQSGRNASGDGGKDANKDGGGGEVKSAAPTPVPKPTATPVRRQPPTPTPARAGGGGGGNSGTNTANATNPTSTTKAADSKGSGGDGSKGSGGDGSKGSGGDGGKGPDTEH